MKNKNENVKAISGIADIHAKGGKVILSYGYIPVQWDSVGNWRGVGHGGISAQVKLCSASAYSSRVPIIQEPQFQCVSFFGRMVGVIITWRRSQEMRKSSRPE